MTDIVHYAMIDASYSIPNRIWYGPCGSEAVVKTKSKVILLLLLLQMRSLLYMRRTMYHVHVSSLSADIYKTIDKSHCDKRSMNGRPILKL